MKDTRLAFEESEKIKYIKNERSSPGQMTNQIKGQDLFEHIVFLNQKIRNLKKNITANNGKDQYITKKISKPIEKALKLYISMSLSGEVLHLKDLLDDFEKKAIEYALFLSFNNQRKAATLLGFKYTTFVEKIKRLKIEKGKILRA